MRNIAVIGLPGSGKTLLMAQFAIKYHENGHKCYSNFRIHIPGESQPVSKLIISEGDLQRAHSGAIFFDEVAKINDSRHHQTKDNDMANAALQTLRKHDVMTLFWSAQMFHMGDNRLRENTEYIILPELYYTVDGQHGSEEFELDDDFFDPIDRSKYLPYARIRAPLVSAWVYTNMPNLTEKAALRWFDFPVWPVSFCYDTREEINKLTKGEVMKAIEIQEPAHTQILARRFNTNVKLIENSGNKQTDTLDMEMIVDGELWIIDSTTLEQKHENDLGLTVRNKTATKFKHIEKERNAKTFFCFNYPKDSEDVFLYPASALFDTKRKNEWKNNNYINVNKLDKNLMIKVSE